VKTSTKRIRRARADLEKLGWPKDLFAYCSCGHRLCEAFRRDPPRHLTRGYLGSLWKPNSRYMYCRKCGRLSSWKSHTHYRDVNGRMKTLLKKLVKSLGDQKSIFNIKPKINPSTRYCFNTEGDYGVRQLHYLPESQKPLQKAIVCPACAAGVPLLELRRRRFRDLDLGGTIVIDSLSVAGQSPWEKK
jgi:hypothetical protein